jgi:hypothetical protein
VSQLEEQSFFTDEHAAKEFEVGNRGGRMEAPGPCRRGKPALAEEAAPYRTEYHTVGDLPKGADSKTSGSAGPRARAVHSRVVSTGGQSVSDAISTDAHMQAWLTAPEDRRAASHAALIGRSAEQPQPDEALRTLSEVAKDVRRHPTRLHRLEIQKHCGERIGGRFMYRKSRVLEYLRSPECHERIRELHEARIAKEQAKKVGAQ